MSNIIDSIQLSGVTYTIQGSGGGVPESAFTAYTAATDARIAEDEEVTAAALNELNEAISGVSGNNVVELTQEAYDALVSGGTVDPTAFYIITDATAGDLTQYWTSAQTQSAITQATSGKADSSAVTQEISAAVSGKADSSSLATVATSGSYNDLTNKPTIPTVSSAITSGDTNAVQGGAVYDKFDEVEQVTAAALNDLNDRIIQTEATIGDINTILSSI